jgi:hypothetical protein
MCNPFFYCMAIIIYISYSTFSFLISHSFPSSLPIIINYIYANLIKKKLKKNNDLIDILIKIIFIFSRPKKKGWKKHNKECL